MATNKITKTKNHIFVNVEVFIIKEGKQYVAYCPALELSDYGKSEKEAKKSFDVSMNILIKETAKKGTLEKLLLKFGWTLRQSPQVNYVPPILSHKDLVMLKNSQNIVSERISFPV